MVFLSIRQRRWLISLARIAVFFFLRQLREHLTGKESGRSLARLLLRMQYRRYLTTTHRQLSDVYITHYADS